MEKDEDEPVITHRERLAYKKSFDMIDVNKDGSLNRTELTKVWNVLGFHPTDKDVDNMMMAADINDDGKITFPEYLKMATENRVFRKLNEEIENMKMAFMMFDKDSDGYITKDEFKKALNLNNEYITEKDIESFFDDIDVDGDGKIEIDEFIKSKFCCPLVD